MLYIPFPFVRCTQCNRSYATMRGNFNRDSRTRSGYRANCKACEQKYRRDNATCSYEKNKERHRRWRQANPEKMRAKNHRSWVASFEKNPDRVRTEQRKRYRKMVASPEKRAEINKQQRKRRIECAEKSRSYQREWMQSRKNQNRSTYDARFHRYRARKRGLPAAFSDADWLRATAYFGGCCAVCGRPPGLWHTMAQDHWIPLTSPECPGTIPCNILPLCHGIEGCNNSKGDRDPVKWLTWKYGKSKANVILERIRAYFASLE